MADTDAVADTDVVADTDAVTDTDASADTATVVLWYDQVLFKGVQTAGKVDTHISDSAQWALEGGSWVHGIFLMASPQNGFSHKTYLSKHHKNFAFTMHSQT